MTVLILERVPAALRGELTRWLLEPKSGVFVGNPSAMVRERLWDLAREKAHGGSCTMIHTTQSEQGFDLVNWGSSSHEVANFEGLFLIRVPRRGEMPGTGAS